MSGTSALWVSLALCTCLVWAATGMDPVDVPDQETGEEDLFHAVFPVECKLNSLLWQTVGLWYSFRKSKMPGSFTRLLACKEEKRQEFQDAGAMDICPTHVTPSYTEYKTRDSYGPYNMAGTILHWVTHVTPKEKYVLILDSDMVILRPLLPGDLGVLPGRAVAAQYGYLKGVSNDLALRHIPEITPRNDSLGGPRGRRSDQAGGVQAMAFTDLQRVAPLWLEYTKRVREDPKAWEDTGDVYVRPGGKPWISEMYGYSFGCAKADVWHVTNQTMMLYPEYHPTGFPSVMHYGIEFHIGDGYNFHKHWFPYLDALKCPPWQTTAAAERSGLEGLLPAPPHPRELADEGSIMDKLQHLYAAATVATLNEALCELHLKRCELSQFLLDTCLEAMKLSDDIYQEIREQERIASGETCYDRRSWCHTWMESGECERNPDFMLPSCPKSCGVCRQGDFSSGSMFSSWHMLSGDC
eukprot:CAMPEP_0117679248 /NCGR_PEP_ID=MMETSP0804-20121206/17717_1 /TAXON_ID=1074897 /ORGANISM="Tetraselmis astigmatica, Strain CCMP880" /LENGTH=467 /DNA_ID=CAMNT_0005488665 /DNA_START=196 /DNA_END=1599 /DNA_ORIENTATION=+